MTYKPITSLLRRLEEITAETPPENSDRHRRLLAARKILQTYIILETAGTSIARGQVNKAVLAALDAYGEPPYMHFLGGDDPPKNTYKRCSACGELVLWGRAGPRQYHDCKNPNSHWIDA
jgi:hypothetical protein